MIAKYKYFSSGCNREMLVDVELVNDFVESWLYQHESEG